MPRGFSDWPSPLTAPPRTSTLSTLGTPQLGWALFEVLGTCRPPQTTLDALRRESPMEPRQYPGICAGPVASPSSPGILVLPCARGMAGQAKALYTDDKAQGAPGQWGPQGCSENSALRVVQCITCTPTVVALGGPSADTRADGLGDLHEPCGLAHRLLEKSAATLVFLRLSGLYAPTGLARRWN